MCCWSAGTATPRSARPAKRWDHIPVVLWIVLTWGMEHLVGQLPLLCTIACTQNCDIGMHECCYGA